MKSIEQYQRESTHKTVGITVTNAEYAALALWARKHGLTVQDVLDVAVGEYLESIKETIATFYDTLYDN